jgi:hypothetical protein
MFIYRGETLVAKKIGLLQSKRLYPENNDVEEDDEIGFLYGMNAFIRREGLQAVGALHRQYAFTEACNYGAIHVGSDQIASIDRINRDFGKVAYYLLYNPHVVPLSINYPLQARIRVDEPGIGCRVLDADKVHLALSGLSEGATPTFAMISRANAGTGWALEVWAADMLLTCQVGQQFDDTRDTQVRSLLERRSGPIGAALAVSITLPDS